ncbi:MAG: hypothetical protein WCX69_00470 [Candidatus Paceibacterota bacterium]
MKINRKQMLVFMVADTVFLAALWYFVIPGFLENTLDDQWVHAFYYYGFPLVWAIVSLRLIAMLGTKNKEN